MALQLVLQEPIQASNDGLTMIVRDNTGDGNLGWGTGTNSDYTTIDGTNHSLSMVVSVYDTDKTETVYDSIDFYTDMNNSQPPSSLSQLVFTIDATVLEESGVAYGTINDTLPEGVYKFVYTLTNLITSAVESTVTVYSLIIPLTMQKVYDKLREIPSNYSYGNLYSEDLFIGSNRKVYPWSYLKGIEAQIHWANREETIDQVVVLKSLCETL